ncbi:hypothetical protein BDV11DRAFT_173082 [Aspergillus similis]
MASQPKSHVIRVTGLPKGQSDKNLAASLLETLNNSLTPEEKSQIQADVTIVPSCYRPDRERVGLVRFHGGAPRFLSALTVNPLEGWQVEMGDTDISFDSHFFGFTQLYALLEEEPVAADIIAIAGLDGHAYGSWQGRGNLGRMWLRDFLSKDLPQCRTMIYGYNSKLSSHGIDTILDYGRELMEEIKQVRNTKELQQRPIFFIAHSFGGIILAHCLVRAIQTMDNDHPAITSLHRATYGMILFAIPHKGLVIDDIQQMLAISGNYSREHLLQQISHQSDVLAQQLADFKNLIRDRKVISFYETGQTKQLEFLPDHVEDKVPLHADHSMIVKYNTRNEPGYRAVLDKLQQFAKDAPQVIAARFTQPAQPAQPARTQSDMGFTSHGGPQHNYVHRGHGAYYVNSGNGKQYNAEQQSFVIEAEEDFSFREPAGMYLGRAPYIASDLFVGRGKELDEISDLLQPPNKSQEQQRLVLGGMGGMGGIGKTQLAIAYARSCPQVYDSVFWLNAESEATLKESFLSITKQVFRLRQPEKLKAEEAVPNPVAGKKITIHPLDNLEDGLMILQSRSKRDKIKTDPHAKRLAERLAGLPLALATAGAYLQHSPFTFERYLQEYELRWNIDPRRPTRLEEYQNRTLFTTWDLSYTRVREVDPDAAELLKLFAYFSNQSLWYELLQAGLTDISP